jgi:hypothetical protein
MTRRRLLLGLVLPLLAGSTLSLPAVHGRLIGWARGQAFFEGRPTSWWEREIRTAYGLALSDEHGVPYRWYVRKPPPSTWESFTSLLLGYPSMDTQDPSLTDGDPKALPVLVELIRSPHAKARWVAVSGLGALGRKAPEALPALMAAARDDGDEEVRLTAIWEVRRIDPDAADRAAPVDR